MLPRAARFYENVIQMLSTSGMSSTARALESEYGSRIAARRGRAGKAAAHGRLPAKCLNCGAPARSDAIEWIDLESAECSFCGGVIQTE